MKYRCKICGYIYDELKEGVKFSDLPDDWKCPTCGVGKDMFELVEEESPQVKKEKRIFKYAVPIADDNPGVDKDDSVCIDCGNCRTTCYERCGLSFGEDTSKCLACGQCIMTCPTGALRVKSEVERVKDAIVNNKILIAYTSPAVRVSFGECFHKEPGTFMAEKLIGVLRKLGFKYVLDTTFGADLTIMEEARELKNRLLYNGVLPMFTSCCPAWVKYCEQCYPEVIPHLSSCKSPIGMQGEMVKSYFVKQMNLNPDQVFTVAITPCTAKKLETKKEEIPGTDAVLTVTEVADWIKNKNILLSDIEDSSFDSVFGEGSGGGTIFGNTGGVCESALRNLYHEITGEDYNDEIHFDEVRGYENNVKEASIQIKDKEVKVAVIHKLSATQKIIEDVKNGISPYTFIEIMNCQGGCIGGGGQPRYADGKEQEVKEKRIAGLYQRDKETIHKAPYQNPNIIKIYQDFLIEPNSDIAEYYLHTTYKNRK